MSLRLAIFDLDGTLYRGDEVVPHAVEAVEKLRRAGVDVRFVTNNSGRTQQDFATKLTRMGYSASPGEVVSSAVGAVAHAQAKGIQSAFVVGEPGLVASLRAVGVTVPNADQHGRVGPSELGDAVFAGICRHFDYLLMESAMQRIVAGAPFIATNRDATFPLEGGRFQPGAGSIVAALETCGGVSPVVIGKPEPFLIQMLLDDAGVAAEDAVVVGDRLDTDIESGRRAGCETFLVLTGVESATPPGQAGGADLRDLVAKLGL